MEFISKIKIGNLKYDVISYTYRKFFIEYRVFPGKNIIELNFVFL